MSIVFHNVQFNKEVTFVDHTGVNFTNTTTGEVASAVTSAVASPNSIIEYELTWVVDPVAGDEIEFSYAGGNYTDVNLAAMENVTLSLTNCLDTTGSESTQTQTDTDLDGDGNSDTIIFESGDTTISIDSDSINIDLDGDGVADIEVPR
jgi:hypothetical protein